MSYHIINTGNPNHLRRRKRYGPKHPLNIGRLHTLWGSLPSAKNKLSPKQWRRKRRMARAVRESRRKNRR